MKTEILALTTGTALFLILPQTGHAGSHLISDFDDGIPDWQFEGGTIQDKSYAEIDGQLVMSGWFPATLGNLANSFAGVGWVTSNNALTDGQTVECQVDLVRMSGDNVLAGIEIVSGTEMGNYAIMLSSAGGGAPGQDRLGLWSGVRAYVS